MKWLPPWLFKAPSSSVHCRRMGGRSLEGRKEWDMKRSCLHLLPPWVTWCSVGSAMRKRTKGARSWSLLVDAPALSRYIGTNIHHVLNISWSRFLEAISYLKLLPMVFWHYANVTWNRSYACSMLTGDVCRDGVMRRGAPSVRFAFRLVCLHIVSCYLFVSYICVLLITVLLSMKCFFSWGG
jgi:hypothetical protein